MAFELAFQKSVLQKWRSVRAALNGAFLQKALLQTATFIKVKANEKAFKALFKSFKGALNSTKNLNLLCKF